MSEEVEYDIELNAMQTVLDALTPLDGQALRRVLDYVFKRLSLPQTADLPLAVRPEGPALPTTSSSPGQSTQSTMDIKSLKVSKGPTSSNQMAALVAYYLSELAPHTERTNEITAADISKYFKQAGFPLPNKPAMTLPNATAAGYLDAIGGGRYRLNPVGFNLVAHHLPRSGDLQATGSRTKSRKRARAATSRRRKS